MDFSDITDIAIPAGDVTEIKDKNGVILWQKAVTEISTTRQILWVTEKKIFVVPAIVEWDGKKHTCLITSSDGINWKSSYVFNDRVSNWGTYLYYFSKSQKYIFLASGKKAISNDFLSWEFNNSSPQYINSSTVARTVYSENLDKLLTGGLGSAASAVVVSNDGVTTESNISPYHVCFAKTINKFCAVFGIGAGLTTYKTATSSDGLNWTSKQGNNFPEAADISAGWHGICYADELKKFLGITHVLNNNNNNNYYAAFSDDGIEWTFQKANGLEATGAGRGLFWISSLRKFIFYSGTAIFISSDGINWTKVFFSDALFIWDMCWSETLKKCCGVVNTSDNTKFQSLVSSSNCTSWTKYTILPMQQN